jgi:hypothetical protein
MSPRGSAPPPVCGSAPSAETTAGRALRCPGPDVGALSNIATVESVSTARHQQTSHQQTFARTQVREPGTEIQPPRSGGGVSVSTLAVASTSSVVSAVVVSHIWGPGTLYGAAATPVIVALVSEAVQRPRRVLETARQARAFDPLAEGRRGLDEGDLAAAAPGTAGERTVHRAPPGPRVPRMPKRRSVLIALATGLIAFAIAAFVLTGSELVFGSSSVGGGSSRTTLFGGSAQTSKHTKRTPDSSSKSSKSDKQRRTRRQTSTETTPTPTAPTTTTPETIAPGTTTGPTQTSTGSGGTSSPSTQPTQPTQTAPSPTGSPSPTTNQPPSTATPAPAPGGA